MYLSELLEKNCGKFGICVCNSPESPLKIPARNSLSPPKSNHREVIIPSELPYCCATISTRPPFWSRNRLPPLHSSPEVAEMPDPKRLTDIESEPRNHFYDWCCCSRWSDLPSTQKCLHPSNAFTMTTSLSGKRNFAMLSYEILINWCGMMRVIFYL